MTPAVETCLIGSLTDPGIEAYLRSLAPTLRDMVEDQQTPDTPAIFQEIDEFLVIACDTLDTLKAATLKQENADILRVILRAHQALTRLRQELEDLWPTLTSASRDQE